MKNTTVTTQYNNKEVDIDWLDRDYWMQTIREEVEHIRSIGNSTKLKIILQLRPHKKVAGSIKYQSEDEHTIIIRLQYPAGYTKGRKYPTTRINRSEFKHTLVHELGHSLHATLFPYSKRNWGHHRIERYAETYTDYRNARDWERPGYMIPVELNLPIQSNKEKIN